MEAIDTTEIESSDRTAGETRLWLECLRCLVEDAAAYWQGKTRNAPAHEIEQAFDDICRAGPMTRRCCAFLDVEPSDVQAAFIDWCERGSIT